MNNVIHIERIEIKQDTFGRYCLNDLHKAAGGEAVHAPAQFFRLDKTEALVDELAKCADMHITPLQSKRGNGGRHLRG